MCATFTLNPSVLNLTQREEQSSHCSTQRGRWSEKSRHHLQIESDL